MGENTIVSLATVKVSQMEVAIRQMQSLFEHLRSISVYFRCIEKREEFRRTLNNDNVAVAYGQIVGIEASTPPLQGAMQEIWQEAELFCDAESTFDRLWGKSISIIFYTASCFVEYFAYDGPLDWKFVAELLKFRQTIEAMIDIENNRLKFALQGVQPSYCLRYGDKCYASLDNIVVQMCIEEGGASEFMKYNERPLNLDTRNALMNTLERYESIRIMKELEVKMRQYCITYKCKVKKDESMDNKEKKTYSYNYADGEEPSLLYFVWDECGERQTCYPDANGVKLMLEIIAEKKRDLARNGDDTERKVLYDPRYPEDDPDFGKGDNSNEQPHGFFACISTFFRNLGHKL